jgi:hypothetical protein
LRYDRAMRLHVFTVNQQGARSIYGTATIESSSFRVARSCFIIEGPLQVRVGEEASCAVMFQKGVLNLKKMQDAWGS